jgi:hypothetical protein
MMVADVANAKRRGEDAGLFLLVRIWFVRLSKFFFVQNFLPVAGDIIGEGKNFGHPLHKHDFIFDGYIYCGFRSIINRYRNREFRLSDFRGHRLAIVGLPLAIPLFRPTFGGNLRRWSNLFRWHLW